MIERRIGDAYMECLGEAGPSVIVFAEKEDGKVLGLHALEGMRLKVDPATGELRKAEAGLALASSTAQTTPMWVASTNGTEFMVDRAGFTLSPRRQRRTSEIGEITALSIPGTL